MTLNSKEATERALTADERALLTLVLGHAGEDGAKFLGLIDATVVHGQKCKCGCPTVDLKSPEAPIDLRDSTDPFGNVFGVIAEGLEVGVLVFASRRQLSMLEVFCFGSNDGPFGLPLLSSLRNQAGEPIRVAADA